MLSLPAIFSDHMVFQREKNILLWGESDEKNVTAVIDEKKVSSDVNNRRWLQADLMNLRCRMEYRLKNIQI